MTKVTYLCDIQSKLEKVSICDTISASKNVSFQRPFLQILHNHVQLFPISFTKATQLHHILVI